MAHLAKSSFSRPGKMLAKRLMSSSVSFNQGAKRAVLIGMHDSDDSPDVSTFASELGERYAATESNKTDFIREISSSGPRLKEGQSRIVGKAGPNNEDLVVLMGLGKRDRPEESRLQGHDLAREAIRAAVASGIRSVKDLGIADVVVDACGDDEAVAEGAHLATWAFDELKAKKDAVRDVLVRPFGQEKSPEWTSGEKKAKGQNLARSLMETPANFMTPKDFADRARAELSPLNVDVKIRGVDWVTEKKMGAFLSVAKGSRQDPVFLEMDFANSKSAPVVFVGKGVTFDTGGISLKPPKDMDKMRGDMGGAACVTGALYTAAALNYAVNLKVLIPLCENMPGGAATRPGDVVTAMNGKTIQVDNTDAEGRLILADALCYADTFKPRVVVDVATLTGAIAVALGGASCGVYTTSDETWTSMNLAAFKTGDRVWRMPLWNYYGDIMKKSKLADLNNIGGKPYGGSCTAAGFLKEFVSCDNWTHVDIAGLADNSNDVSYLSNGMSGRPTRTLSEFLRVLSLN